MHPAIFTVKLFEAAANAGAVNEDEMKEDADTMITKADGILPYVDRIND